MEPGIINVLIHQCPYYRQQELQNECNLTMMFNDIQFISSEFQLDKFSIVINAKGYSNIDVLMKNWFQHGAEETVLLKEYAIMIHVATPPLERCNLTIVNSKLTSVKLHIGNVNQNSNSSSLQFIMKNCEFIVDTYQFYIFLDNYNVFPEILINNSKLHKTVILERKSTLVLKTVTIVQFRNCHFSTATYTIITNWRMPKLKNNDYILQINLVTFSVLLTNSSVFSSSAKAISVSKSAIMLRGINTITATNANTYKENSYTGILSFRNEAKGLFENNSKLIINGNTPNSAINVHSTEEGTFNDYIQCMTGRKRGCDIGCFFQFVDKDGRYLRHTAMIYPSLMHQ